MVGDVDPRLAGKVKGRCLPADDVPIVPIGTRELCHVKNATVDKGRFRPRPAKRAARVEETTEALVGDPLARIDRIRRVQ